MQIAILGPTASGKSALALSLARRLKGNVVNGDPFQSLAGIPIGTGQPLMEEQAGVPHLGYGVLPLSTALNPQSFGGQVRQWLSKGPHSVLVTGSGLYLRGIWQQLDELPEVDPAITARVRTWNATLGSPVLHRYLRSVDPARAAELHPNDGSRVQRALALHLETGERPSSLLQGIRRGVPEGWKALLLLPSREHLRERVAMRVHEMVQQGWPKEVQRMIEAGHAEDIRRLRPLGYLNWLEGGDASKIEAQIIQETQAFAKRQSTWFRNQLPDVQTWDPDRESLETALDKFS